MTTPTIRNSLPSLWEQAVALWKELVLGYGRPKDFMRWGRMRALYHRSVGHCLREIEKIVRRAIRTDAEDLDLPPLKPLPKRPKRPSGRPLPASPEDRLAHRAPDPADATTWKVTFRMTPRVYDPARKRCTRNPPNLDPEALRPCRGYAFRIEALRRVIANRDAYVQRHARRLARIEEARIEAVCAPMRRYLEEKSRQAAASPEAAPQTTPRNAKHVEPG
jgi:hypothetical protein